jgi:hypothetical protein
MIKSRRIRWVEHIARMGKMRNGYKVLVRHLKGRDQFRDKGVDGRIAFK